jgi:hypothetical protein
MSVDLHETSNPKTRLTTVTISESKTLDNWQQGLDAEQHGPLLHLLSHNPAAALRHDGVDLSEDISCS